MLFKLRRELGPMSGDSFAEEDGRELADVGGFSGAEMLNKSGNNLRIFGKTFDLILCLTPSIIVWHEKLDQEKFERLRHSLFVD